MGAVWSKEEVDILINNYKDCPREQILSLLPNKSLNNIRYYARKYGLRCKKELCGWQRKDKWTEKEIELLQDNYGKIDTKKLVNLFPSRSLQSIYDKANQLRLIGDVSITKRVNNVNDNFFSVPNPISSYVAGFIAADGCITKNGCKVSISQKDPEILQIIKDLTGFKGPITHTSTRGDICYNITIASKQWVSDLYNIYNITNNKSLSLKPPKNLDELNTLSYIVGLIDGDGCILTFTNKGYTKKYLRLRVINTIWIVDWLKEVLKEGSVRKNLKGYKPETGTYDCVCGKAFRVITRLINIRELENIRMKRKWDKILELNL